MIPVTDPSHPVLALLLALPLLEETDTRFDPYPFVREPNPKLVVWDDEYEGPRSDLQLYGLGTQGGRPEQTAMWLLRGLYEEKARYAQDAWKVAVRDTYVKLGGDLQYLQG